MKKNSIAFGLVAAVAIVLLLYRKWFGLTPLSAGDWSFHFPQSVSSFFVLPSSWMFWLHWGLGGNGVFLSGLEVYFLATARIFHMVTGLNWAWYERVVWYVPFLLVGTFSSLVLSRTVIPSTVFWWLAPVIFLANTYILMVTGGGQMGVALAYSVAPLVLASFIKLLGSIDSSEQNIKNQKSKIKNIVFAGLSLGLQVLFDSRIAYVTMIGVGVYIVTSLVRYFVGRNKNFFQALFSTTLGFGFSVVIAAGINAFWILPLIVFRVNPIASLGAAYGSAASVKFFSFADFSHAIALLHPNWPENLFGKTYFLQPEFLIVPLLAFSSLLHISKIKNQKSKILFFAFLALLGAFLAKGANGPFGEAYLWMFERVPGFNAFRDPTKFYLLIAIAYSVLIPVSLEQIRIFFKRLPLGTFVILVLFLALWLSTIRQFVRGQLGGTFVAHTVPQDYEVLKDVINKPEYFRTLWIPHTQRYGWSTYTHPAIDLGSLLETGSPSAILAWIDSPGTAKQLARWSVKYVILPYDSQGEIFVDDRTYSANVQRQFQTALDANPYLKKITIARLDENLSVYETGGYNDHLWLEGESTTAKLSWRMTSPATYTLSITGLEKPTKLIFSESYDSKWRLRLHGQTVVPSQATADKLNSFLLPDVESVTGTLEYAPQQYVWYGLIVSLFVLTVAGIALVIK